MWRPSERIKYQPQPGPWPTREEAEASMLFSPIDIGAQKLRQRTWVPAMVPWRATEEGFVTQDILDWYRRYAEGRAHFLRGGSRLRLAFQKTGCRCRRARCCCTDGNNDDQ